jgi:hypothetical protein
VAKRVVEDLAYRLMRKTVGLHRLLVGRPSLLELFERRFVDNPAAIGKVQFEARIKELVENLPERPSTSTIGHESGGRR